MTVMSGKIDLMKSMSYPVAILLSVVTIVLGVLIFEGKDPNALVWPVILLAAALGYAELREIKGNTNGTNKSLMEQNAALMSELAEYRRQNQQNLKAVMENPSVPVAVLPPTPVSAITQNESVHQ